MRYSLFLLPVFLFTVTTSTLQAVTVHVPGDYPAIQEAINNCVDGDTVLVASGTYVENIDFLGKALIVKSESGPDVTVIDGSNPVNPDSGSVVFLKSGEGPNSVLDGFTLTSGSGTLNPGTGQYRGGGIFCSGSSPTILDNIVTGNSADVGGGFLITLDSSPTIIGNTISGNYANEGAGGINIYHSNPTISYCTISKNVVESGSGGGMLLSQSHAMIVENEISGNVSTFGGGGIWSTESDSAGIVDNVISGNSAATFGGGIGVDGSNPEILANVISGNTSSNIGGGIFCQLFSSPMIVANEVILNEASNSGGGIACMNASPALIEGNKIIANISNDSGAGLFILYSDVTVVNSTISENVALNEGGGIRCFHSDPTIINTILWDNHAPEGAEMWIGQGFFSSSLTISYSDVKGGQDSVFVDNGSTLNWGDGMIDLDPLFMTYKGYDYLLDVGSPCIDTGDPLIEDGISDWHPRWPDWLPNGLRSDMGAYGGPGNKGWLP